MINPTYLYKFESPQLQKLSNKRLEELYRQIHEAYKEWQDEQTGEETTGEEEDIIVRSVSPDMNPELQRQIAVLREQVENLTKSRTMITELQRDEDGRIIGKIERTG